MILRTWCRIDTGFAHLGIKYIFKWSSTMLLLSNLFEFYNHHNKNWLLLFRIKFRIDIGTSFNFYWWFLWFCSIRKKDDREMMQKSPNRISDFTERIDKFKLYVNSLFCVTKKCFSTSWYIWEYFCMSFKEFQYLKPFL